MINPHDYIRYKNVISRRYQFHYDEMNQVMADFEKDVRKLNVTLNGPLFYSINNVPMDEILLAEFFMPIEEEQIEVMDDMYFHSYFSIEDMVSLSIFDQFETKTEMAYAALFQYIEENDARQVTPIFHTVLGDETFPYMFIKIGIAYNQEIGS